MGDRKEMSFSLRAVIVAYHFDQRMSYAEIGLWVGKGESTIRKLCNRVLDNANGDRDLRVLLQNLEDKPRAGRPPKNEPADETSDGVRDRED